MRSSVHVNFGPPVPITDIVSTPEDILSPVGITSTPVIDLQTQTLYAVAKTKEGTSGRAASAIG